jgi:hypothetical protein
MTKYYSVKRPLFFFENRSLIVIAFMLMRTMRLSLNRDRSNLLRSQRVGKTPLRALNKEPLISTSSNKERAREEKKKPKHIIGIPRSETSHPLNGLGYALPEWHR